jgi:hypothetical protein
MEKPDKFQVGETYTHEEIYRGLKVGNAGGIRPCLDNDGEVRRLVVMTSEPSARVFRENPYHDRVEGDILVYTAAGREGQQNFSGINRRLLDQSTTPFPIYGFTNTGSRRDTKLGVRRWRFLGLLEFLRHYSETQVDSRSESRQVVVFELFIHREPHHVVTANDTEIFAEVYRNRTITRDDDAEREVIVTSSIPSPLAIPLDGHTAESIRRSLLAVSPERFEHVVKDALNSTGFERVTVTRFTGDGGVDVNAFAGPTLWPYQNGLLQVQAKRWLHTVGRREVAELRGSLQPYAQGALVTTSFFTKAALAEASEVTKKPIVLINGLEFAEVLWRLGQTKSGGGILDA